MRMVLHGLTDDVRHFIITAIIHFFHCMKNAALNGFQPILYRGNRSFQDHIRSIIQEPVLILALNAGFGIKKNIAFIFCSHIYSSPKCDCLNPEKYLRPYPSIRSIATLYVIAPILLLNTYPIILKSGTSIKAGYHHQAKGRKENSQMLKRSIPNSSS